MQIVISTDQQKLYLYSDGSAVAETLVATGVPAHPTPLGVFSVIQKSLLHHSNIYSGAPMPFMQRITWSGVAIHEGVNLGHPASHGCIRMSHDFATRLWVLTRLGARVIIAQPELRPQDIADPHLFTHVDKPAAEAKTVKTAQSIDDVKTSDVADPPKDAIAGPAKVEAVLGDQSAKSVVHGTGMASAELAAPAPTPPATPVVTAHGSKAPISVFISRKTKRLYVRQDFLPLFDAPITIEQPEQKIGTHVLTALEYLPDRSAFRWNVISLPGDRIVQGPNPGSGVSAKGNRAGQNAAKLPIAAPPPQAPQQALARIEIPQDVVERISQLIVPGSSVTISDEGLGEETGEGTDFVVLTPAVQPQRFVSGHGMGQRVGRFYGDEAPVYAPAYRTYYPYRNYYPYSPYQ